MPHYIAEVSQSGGCDYTIGCGLVTVTLHAKDLPSAEAEALALLDRYGEDQIETIEVHEVTRTVKLNIKAERQRRAAERKREEKAARERAERAEYERLRTKFER